MPGWVADGRPQLSTTLRAAFLLLERSDFGQGLGPGELAVFEKVAKDGPYRTLGFARDGVDLLERFAVAWAWHAQRVEGGVEVFLESRLAHAAVGSSGGSLARAARARSPNARAKLIGGSAP